MVALRIVPLTSSRGVKRYYQSMQTAYYLGGGLHGIWGGKGAERLKLKGQVGPREFAALVDNQHPTGARGRRLTLRTRAKRRVAYDFNTHAPKSVSLLATLTKDQRLVDAHHEATVELMAAIEQHASTRVRAKGASTDRPTGNLTWAAFTDTVSRPVGGVPDPHLHEHVVVFNATYDHEEARWKAAQFGDIKKNAPLFQAMFSMALAKKLTRLGYQLKWDGPRWEVKGVPEEILPAFSRRTELINKQAEKRGVRSARVRADLGVRTRERKTDHRWDELIRIWSDRLNPNDLSALEAVKAAAHTSAASQSRHAISPENALESAIETLSRHASIWTEEDMLVAALYAGHGDVDLAQIRAVLGAQVGVGPNRLLKGHHRGSTVYTTEKVLREEKACIELARALRGQLDALGGMPCQVLPDGRCLSGEQLAAARVLTESTDFVTCLHGKAGTGKSTLVSAVVPALEEANRKVIALAPTHKAVGVLRSDGFDGAMTLAKFLGTASRSEIPPGSVIWLDEAGLAGIGEMASLLELAKTKRCRVVLAGDLSQHTPVARGDALRLLIQRAELKTASVATIVRQTDPDYRAAVQALAAGKTNPESPERGLRLLHRNGKICTYPDAEDRFTEAAKKIASLAASGLSHIAIAPTHGEIAELTKAVRNEASERGLIDKSRSHDVADLREVALTLVEKKTPWLYQAGHVVELNRDVPWAKRGERLTVVHADYHRVTVQDSKGRKSDLNLADSANFQVYTRSTIEVAVGDRIRVRKTSRLGIETFIGGGIHTVRDFDSQGNMILDDGRVLPQDFGHLDYGWATTSHASQGMTVDHVVLVQSAASGRAASLEQVYVSASRGKKDVWIFTDDASSLRKAVSRTSERTSALEVFMPLDQSATVPETGTAVPPAPRIVSLPPPQVDSPALQWPGPLKGYSKSAVARTAALGPSEKISPPKTSLPPDQIATEPIPEPSRQANPVLERSDPVRGYSKSALSHRKEQGKAPRREVSKPHPSDMDLL